MPKAPDRKLADRIISEHKAGEKKINEGLEHFRRAGEMLKEAKQNHGQHGKWGKWLEKNVPNIPQQRASEYVRLAEGWDKLPPGGNLRLKAALRIVAGKEPKKRSDADPNVEDDKRLPVEIYLHPNQIRQLESMLDFLCRAFEMDDTSQAVLRSVRIAYSKEKIHDAKNTSQNRVK